MAVELDADLYWWSRQRFFEETTEWSHLVQCALL
jgi:hypothetical protein